MVQQTIEVYSGLSTDTKPTAGQAGSGALYVETDTGRIYQNTGSAWVNVPSRVVQGSSAGLTVVGNLNPSFTPAANALLAILATYKITAYTSGTIGFAVNYIYATAGASAADEIVPVTNSSGTAAATGGAAGNFKAAMTMVKASGGHAVQLKTKGNFVGKYTIDYEILQVG